MFTEHGPEKALDTQLVEVWTSARKDWRRFLKQRVIDKSGCWLWTGPTRSATGYGRFTLGRRGLAAHRYAYEQVWGPIPKGLVVHHTCNQPRCVNPNHLEAVTMRENTLRGSSPSSCNAKKMHCSKGHPYSPENLVFRKGIRCCRTCERMRAARTRQGAVGRDKRPSARWERFLRHVQKAPGPLKTHCWLWTGYVEAAGYGITYIGKRQVMAHRFAYLQWYGSIPPNLQIDHLCQNRACVNPDHLEAVTPRENTIRGSSPIARNVEVTHCPKGHPYSGKNLYITKKGFRQCVLCSRARTRQHRLDPEIRKLEASKLRRKRARLEVKQQLKASLQRYRSRPEVKQRRAEQARAHYARPDVHAKMRAQAKQYRATAEYKEWRKDYLNRPDVRERERARERQRHLMPKRQAWLKKYRSRPDVKARQAALERARQARLNGKAKQTEG
ncbi:MAG: HNH endonuclease signature motif containing protein [Nitrospirota bacterium]